MTEHADSAHQLSPSELEQFCRRHEELFGESVTAEEYERYRSLWLEEHRKMEANLLAARLTPQRYQTFLQRRRKLYPDAEDLGYDAYKEHCREEARVIMEFQSLRPPEEMSTEEYEAYCEKRHELYSRRVCGSFKDVNGVLIELDWLEAVLEERRVDELNTLFEDELREGWEE